MHLPLNEFQAEHLMQGVDIPIVAMPGLGLKLTAQPLVVSYSGTNNIRSDHPSININSNLWCGLRLCVPAPRGRECSPYSAFGVADLTKLTATLPPVP